MLRRVLLFSAVLGGLTLTACTSPTGPNEPAPNASQSAAPVQVWI